MHLDVNEDPQKWCSFPMEYPFVGHRNFDEWFASYREIYLPDGEVSAERVEIIEASLRAVKVVPTPGLTAVLLHLDSPSASPLFVLVRVVPADLNRTVAEESGAYDSDTDRPPVVDTLRLGRFEYVKRTIATYSDSSGATSVLVTLAADIDGQVVTLSAYHENAAVVMAAVGDMEELFETWGWVDDQNVDG